VLVIDDFAHHPTAVAVTVRSLRRRYSGRKLWAVFEAKSNTSRRAIFQHDYPPAFEGADVVVLSEPWKRDDLPEAERISIPQMARDIAARGAEVVEIPAVDGIVEYLAARVASGDVVVGLSGSDFGGFHTKLLAALAD
jgi:UDP-N-acetylmuramate: L-alanyl-gamma-D-glutamyl-meso-diaminopimelate ligase